MQLNTSVFYKAQNLDSAAFIRKLSFFTPALQVSTRPHAMGHPFGQPRPSVLDVSRPCIWGTPRYPTGGAAPEADRSLALDEHCSATAETSRCYHHHFHQKYRAWHCVSLYKEKLSQSQATP